MGSILGVFGRQLTMPHGQFSPKYTQYTPNSQAMRLRHGFLFARPQCGFYFTFVILVLWAVSYWAVFSVLQGMGIGAQSLWKLKVCVGPSKTEEKQGKSEGIDSCDRPSNLTQIGFKSSIFQPVWPWNLMDDPKNNRAPFLCYFKLFASFLSHWWIQTGITVWKHLIWVKIDDFFSRVTLQFDGWPWKTIRHLFYATSSFVRHFVVIGEFKLELQSGNPQFGSNSMIFRALWPCNLTDDLQKQ